MESVMGARGFVSRLMWRLSGLIAFAMSALKSIFRMGNTRLTKPQEFWKSSEGLLDISGVKMKAPEIEEIKKDLEELKPLPLGAQEFEEWSDRIISIAGIQAHKDDQKFALADMILHLNPTEDFQRDGYFAKRLRKVANNEVAAFKRKEYHEKGKARHAAAEEESKKKIMEEAQKLFQPGQASAATPVGAADGEVLAEPKV